MPNDNSRKVRQILEEIKGNAHDQLVKLKFEPTSFTWSDFSSNREWIYEYPFLVSTEVTRGLKVRARVNLLGILTIRIRGYVTKPRNNTTLGPEWVSERKNFQSPSWRQENDPDDGIDDIRASLMWAINHH